MSDDQAVSPVAVEQPVNQVEDGVLLLKTDLTIYFALEVKQLLLNAVRHHPALVLDLSAITEIDSTGVQTLALIKREAIRLGHTLRWQGLVGQVAELIAFYGLKAYFDNPQQELPGMMPVEVMHG